MSIANKDFKEVAKKLLKDKNRVYIMNKKRGYLVSILSIIFVILISGCVQEENKISEENVQEQNEVQGEQQSETIQSSFPPGGLGNLCSGEECVSFCHNNRKQCDDYCAENGITYCFPEDGTRANEKDASERGESESYSDYNYFDDVSDLPSCGDKKAFFTTLPLALDGFTTIDPLGLLSPTAHTFPAPHLYFRMERKTPLHAPADITIIRIDLIHATSQSEFADDAAILFGLCSEFKAYFDHVVDLAPKLQKAFDEATADRCDEYTLTYKSGPVDWKKCNKKVNLKVSAGELIGYAGGGEAQAVLDLGAYDSRIEPTNFASPARTFRSELPYNVCALDYFSEELARQLKGRLGGIPELSFSNAIMKSPTCGNVIQDILGTAKGNWFAPHIDTARSGHEPPHLALVQGHIDQTLQAFSNGDSTTKSNLEMGLYYFAPTESGFVNRDFALVKPDGNVYCYETSNTYKKNQRKIIIIQLTDPETLKIEGLDSSGCGSGPWTFDTSTEFER